MQVIFRWCCKKANFTFYDVKIDTKVRTGAGDGVAAANGRLVLGWDGSGVVEAVGSESAFFLHFCLFSVLICYLAFHPPS